MLLRGQTDRLEYERRIPEWVWFGVLLSRGGALGFLFSAGLAFFIRGIALVLWGIVRLVVYLLRVTFGLSREAAFSVFFTLCVLAVAALCLFAQSRHTPWSAAPAPHPVASLGHRLR